MTAKKKRPKKKPGPKPWTLSRTKLEKIFEGAKAGQTEEWIARSVGLSQSTFWAKKQQFQKISKAIKKGRDECLNNDLQLTERSLMKRALGYTYKETEVKEALVRGGVVKLRRITEKHVPPSDLAIFYFLGNRASDKWKSVNRVDGQMPADIQATLEVLAKAVIRADSK